MKYKDYINFDYSSAIEEYIRQKISLVYGEKFNVDITHDTVSEVIYKRCLSGVQAHGATIIIRVASTGYSDASPSGQFSEANDMITLYIAVSKIASTQMVKNTDREATKISKNIWEQLRVAPVNLPPNQLCYIKKKMRKTAFNNEEVDIVQFDLSIKYMEY